MSFPLVLLCIQTCCVPVRGNGLRQEVLFLENTELNHRTYWSITMKWSWFGHMQILFPWPTDLERRLSFTLYNKHGLWGQKNADANSGLAFEGRPRFPSCVRMNTRKVLPSLWGDCIPDHWQATCASGHCEWKVQMCGCETPPLWHSLLLLSLSLHVTSPESG